VDTVKIINTVDMTNMVNLITVNAFNEIDANSAVKVFIVFTVDIKINAIGVPHNFGVVRITNIVTNVKQLA